MRFDMSRRFPTIILVFPKGKDRKVIRTTREAARLLLNEWPTDDGEEFFTAVRTCLEVLLGNGEPENLHEAIVRAAHEGGITAITTDRGLGVLRIYPVNDVDHIRARRDPAPIELHRPASSRHRRRQRKWLSRCRSKQTSIGKVPGCFEWSQNCPTVLSHAPASPLGTEY